MKRLTGEYQIFAQGIEHFVMPITYEGIYCLPTGRDEKTLGADAIAQYVDMIKPEYLITFTDLHTLAHVPTNERWIKCITIDCEPVSVQF
ncbi:MAG: hypothetical protein KKC55_14730, partial [Gammaproteobacteria bacterium]|nr:hypothetical protein [Gammaproteobacteria bacterium]